MRPSSSGITVVGTATTSTTADRVRLRMAVERSAPTAADALTRSGDDARALAAYRASLAIHPHQQEAIDGQARLEHKRIGTDI